MSGNPLGNNVRIKIEKSSFTAMEQVDERETRTEKAIVLETGPEVMKVNPNDTILFKAYNVDEIEVEGEKYVLIPEDDIKYVWNTSK